MRIVATLALLASTTLPAFAQSLEGQHPPDIPFRKAWNADGARGLSDFKGKAVLVEMFATW